MRGRSGARSRRVPCCLGSEGRHSSASQGPALPGPAKLPCGGREAAQLCCDLAFWHQGACRQAPSRCRPAVWQNRPPAPRQALEVSGKAHRRAAAAQYGEEVPLCTRLASVFSRPPPVIELTLSVEDDREVGSLHLSSLRLGRQMQCSTFCPGPCAPPCAFKSLLNAMHRSMHGREHCIALLPPCSCARRVPRGRLVPLWLNPLPSRMGCPG